MSQTANCWTNSLGFTGSRPFAIRLDATDQQQVDHAMVAIVDALGGLDILVNNAGGMVQRSPLAQMSLELVAQGARRQPDQLLPRHPGCVGAPERRRVDYQRRLTGWPERWRPRGSRLRDQQGRHVRVHHRDGQGTCSPTDSGVNAVAPGLILDTPFHEQFNSADGRAAAIEGIALKKPGLPADVAGPILWLADNEAAGFVTGTVTDINGGAYFS